jgi:Protein of unknown function (DUF742)
VTGPVRHEDDGGTQMSASADEDWLDGDSGRLIRPYAVTNGRTSASSKLDLMSMVVATGSGNYGSLEPDHTLALGLCLQPTTVAEVAARLRLPAAVAKVLLSDLIECGAVRAEPPRAASDASNRMLLERLLNGLQRRL